MRADHPALPIIIMTAHSDLDSAVLSYRGGAFEYLPKLFDLDEAIELVHRAARLAGESGRASEIRAALAQTGGYRQEAARLLGWGRNTLTRKI